MGRVGVVGLWLVFAGVMAPASRAHACGGLFCDRPPVNPLAPLPVAQSGENVVFGVDGDIGDGSSVVTAHIQIFYSGAASQFSWVVPVMAVPELSTGTDRLFSGLAAQTQPTFIPTSVVDGTCILDERGLAPGGSQSVPGAGGATGAGGAGGVAILFQGAVGPYDAAVLQSSDASELEDWLTSNGYYLDPHAAQIIETYVQEGKYFVALKLLSGQDVSAIRPIVLTFHGTDPCVPLRLTAIAALPDMPVTVYLLGRSRAVPLGFFELKLDELRIDWPSGGANYAALLSQAANEAGGNAFVTEYAGPSSVASSLLWAPGRFDPAALAAAETPPAYVQALIGQGLGNDPQTLPLLTQYIPMPAEAAGIPPATFYANIAIYWSQYTFPPFDLATLTDQVVANIIEPRRLAQQMIDAHTYLTRLGTFISPEEMNQDPLFAFNPDLPDVAAAHTATLRVMCGNSQFMACNAPVRLELPDGRMAWLRSGVTGATCQYPPYDTSLASLPAAEVVWQRGVIGEGARHVDNVATIQTALAAHNASYVAENTMSPTGTGGSGGRGGGRLNDSVTSGCGCAVATTLKDSGSHAALGLSVGGLALVALLARRRGRRRRHR
jgi:hypothetical protein